MAFFATVYIVQSIGVRAAEDLRISRCKDGRQQRQVEILRNEGTTSDRNKASWVDKALIFKTEEEAKAALLWAKVHRERHSINRTLAHILISVDYIASLALPAAPLPEGTEP